jgi:NTE family protein
MFEALVSVALKAGAKLLIYINPLVPDDAELAERAGAKPMHLAERGLVTVLSQTFRALIHSRMQVGMERYAREFPDADVVTVRAGSGRPSDVLR